MQKYICFRFDIDTHLCLKKGVPNLLKLFREYDARCTFFVSMGTAFQRSVFLKERLQSAFSKRNKYEAGVLPMVYKLGLLESIKAIALNPAIGSANGKILKMLIADSHELGLHGGRNHCLWENEAEQWATLQTASEIQYGLDMFRHLDLPKPESFASPCWKSPYGLNAILFEKGFSIVADTYSQTDEPYKDDIGLIQYPTTILAKQPKVGFIENFRALDYSTNNILDEFENQLIRNNRNKMVFDHPYYAGIKELDVVSQMLEICVKYGYQLESLQNICKEKGL